MHQARLLNYKSLDNFLSERQLSEHHDVLYVGYVNKLNEIEEKSGGADKSKANATFSDFRSLKKEEVFAQNGILLHELYFENLAQEGDVEANISDSMREVIAKDFGSLENWQADLVACAMSARGWVVMAFNPQDGKLHNYICDVHDVGGVWGAQPVLVLDMYEHAYFLDYGTKKKVYIDNFMKNINWQVVNGRVKNLS